MASASELLRKMWTQGVAFRVPGTWEDALPEIIAVVKEAERETGEIKSRELYEALDALASKLSGEGQ